MSITLRKELHVAAQQAGFHLAMANMHVMYDTQRACSPSLITRNVDHFEKRAAHGRPASRLSLSDGQYARDVWYITCMFAIANHTKCRSLSELSKSQTCRVRTWPRQRDGQRQLMTMRWFDYRLLCSSPNDRHWLRDCDACQRTATFKGSRPNSRHWRMVTLAKDLHSAKSQSPEWPSLTEGLWPLQN